MTTLRRFCEDDALTLLTWRNHPETRRVSFTADPIDLREHEAWFKRFLADHRRIGLMMIDEGTPVGMIRFEPAAHPGTLTISIAVAPDRIGRGYGRRLLASALDHPDVRQKATMVRAETMTDNQPSQKIFAATGFRALGHGTREGREYIEWRRPVGEALTGLRFGFQGEGRLLEAALEAVAGFGLAPGFVYQPTPALRQAEIEGFQRFSSEFCVALQEQALATGIRTLFVFEWPQKIPPELDGAFPDGIYVFRRDPAQNESFIELRRGLYESYGVTSGSCSGQVMDVLARQAHFATTAGSVKTS